MNPLDRIQRRAMRLARLAALNAPTIILANAADLLDDTVSELCRDAEFDRPSRRAQRAADEIAARAEAEPLSAVEEAEMASEEAAYERACDKAQAASGYPDDVWLRLDGAYRFDLAMQHYEDPAAASPDEARS